MGLTAIVLILVGLPFSIAAGLWYARRRFEVRTLENQVAQKRYVDPRAEALAILNQRLARGEISADEYQKTRRLIER